MKPSANPPSVSYGSSEAARSERPRFNRSLPARVMRYTRRSGPSGPSCDRPPTEPSRSNRRSVWYTDAFPTSTQKPMLRERNRSSRSYP